MTINMTINIMAINIMTVNIMTINIMTINEFQQLFLTKR